MFNQVFILATSKSNDILRKTEEICTVVATVLVFSKDLYIYGL